MLDQATANPGHQRHTAPSGSSTTTIGALAGSSAALRLWMLLTKGLGALSHRKMTISWRQQASRVAAYRDRYAIVGASALGAAPQTIAQRHDAACARAALEAAKRLADERDLFEAHRSGVTASPAAVRSQI